MSTDTELLSTGNGSDNTIDPSYAEFYEGYEETPESELRVGRSEITRSDFYVLKVTGVDGRLQPFVGGQLEGVITYTVEEGPEGMFGRFINGQMVLGIGKQRRIDPRNPKSGLRDATADELTKAKVALNGTLERAKTKLGLATRFPVSGGIPGVKSWLKAAIGKTIIATAYSDDKGYSKVVNNSLRSPSDEAIDAKTKKPISGKSALEQAREGLKMEAEKAAKKAGKPVNQGASAPSEI